MGLYNFFGKSDNQNNQSTAKNTAPKISAPSQSKNDIKEKLVASLTKSLSEHNFTPQEMQEVFSIIDIAEADMQALKVNLTNIKLNTKDATTAIIKIKREVENIQQQMAADIKTKIRQIKIRKQQSKKKRI